MAFTFETLLIELKLNGAQVTKQQLREIKEEVHQVNNAFSSMASLGGVTLILSQLSQLMQTFGEVSGLNVAAQFRGVAYSLESVLRNSTQTARIWRELKSLGNAIGVNPAVLGSTAARMIGSGVPQGQVVPELRKLMDLIAFGRVKSADIDPFLFNLQQVRGMGSAKADFADIREMISRAPGIQTVLSQGLGVEPKDLMKTLRGKSMSGSQVYEALLKGADGMAKGAAAARALHDPLFAVASLFQTMQQIMEPTGQILLSIGTPFLIMARAGATLLLKINEASGGIFGLTALIGGGLFLATRTATVALWDFVKAMLATSGAAKAATVGSAGSAAAGVAGGGIAGWIAKSWGGLSSVIRGGLIGGIISTVGNWIAGAMQNSGQSYGANKMQFAANGAGIGAIVGSVVPGLGTLAGAALGAAFGLIASFVADLTGHGVKAGQAADPMVQEQKKTNALLKDLKLSPFGGGARTARAISDFEAEYGLRAMYAI